MAKMPTLIVAGSLFFAGTAALPPLAQAQGLPRRIFVNAHKGLLSRTRQCYNETQSRRITPLLRTERVMLEPQVAPYGSWKSPITTDLIVSESISPGQVVLDGQDIYWSETRPSEGGRSVIVR